MRSEETIDAFLSRARATQREAYYVLRVARAHKALQVWRFKSIAPQDVQSAAFLFANGGEREQFLVAIYSLCDEELDSLDDFINRLLKLE